MKKYNEFIKEKIEVVAKIATTEVEDVEQFFKDVKKSVSEIESDEQEEVDNTGRHFDEEDDDEKEELIVQQDVE